MYSAYNYRPSQRRPGFYPGNGLAVRWALSILILLFTLVLLMSFTGAPNIIFWWVHRNPDSIIRAGLPLWADSSPQGRTPGCLLPLVEIFTGPDPLKMLAWQLPVLAAANPGQDVEPSNLAPVLAPGVVPLPDEEMDQPVTPVSDENLVAIYNTHTGETYALTDGTERLNGKRGGVVKVAAALEQELADKHGIKAARSDAINDANYSLSYTKSQETLRALLADNPSVQVVLDIHRDAGKSRENSLVVVDGKEVAPVLIVVGSDARSPFPAWRQNHNFARELSAEINKQHPGLCLGVRILEGRYNQFLHTRAVLLEIGSVSNSTEEAVHSARLLAGPVAEMVKRYLDATPPPD